MMVDPVVNVLLDKLVEYLVSEGRQLLEFGEQFKEMDNELRYIQSYLKEADKVERQNRNEILKTIVADLRELLYDAEDVIASCQFRLRRLHERSSFSYMNLFSPSFLKSRYQLGKRLWKINRSIANVRERMSCYSIASPRSAPQEVDDENQLLRRSISINETELVGLREDMLKIKTWLLRPNDGPLSVMGIVGMAGIGKTTLAQEICNDASMKSCFKHIISISISRSFKVDELVKKMLRKLDVGEEYMVGNGVGDLLTKLKFKLDDAKSLLVLDDVWRMGEGQWWQSWDLLKYALPQANGSCVIVTTRDEEVVKSMGAPNNRIHRLELLSDEESWLLFSNIAFVGNGGRSPNVDLEAAGKEIVTRCGRLPLAIKTVAGMMFGKGDSIFEWRRIANHLKEELAANGRGEVVVSSLELSYQELPAYLKPCLLCFSLYSEASEISIYDIVYRWIGEGFVQEKSGKSNAFEIGQKCFAELVGRCLIQGFCREPFGRGFSIGRMHDLVRDMIIKIAKEENFMGLDDEGRPRFDAQSRRAVILSNSDMEGFEVSSKLRTLVGMDIERKFVLFNLGRNLGRQKLLKVLDLSFSSVTTDELTKKGWLRAIGSLPYLVYFSISNSGLVQLPSSIKNLRNLKILRLSNCPNLQNLPEQVTTLEELTILHIFGCTSLKYMPKGIRKLPNLQKIWGFTPASSKFKDGCRIADLRSLTQLRELAISLRSEDQIQFHELNELSELRHLHRLIIDFKGGEGSVGLARKVDRQISLLPHLQELWIWHFPGEVTSSWLNPVSLPSLRFLCITKGMISRVNPEFFDSQCAVWKLEALLLRGLNNMEEEWPRMQSVLPSLKMLTVCRCPKLKKFPFNDTIGGTWKKQED